MNPVLIGGLMVSVFLMIVIISTTKSTAVATPAGGVSVSNSPSITTPIPDSGTTAALSVVTPPMSAAVKLTKNIIIIKDTTNLTNTTGDNADWQTFQVAEVYAYSGDRKLVASDFSDMTLTPVHSLGLDAHKAVDGNVRSFMHTGGNANIHKLMLTLKEPTQITKVEVLNRQDCCWGRLAGASLVLADAGGIDIWSGTLAGVKDIQLFNM